MTVDVVPDRSSSQVVDTSVSKPGVVPRSESTHRDFVMDERRDDVGAKKEDMGGDREGLNEDESSKANHAEHPVHAGKPNSRYAYPAKKPSNPTTGSGPMNSAKPYPGQMARAPYAPPPYGYPNSNGPFGHHSHQPHPPPPSHYHHNGHHHHMQPPMHPHHFNGPYHNGGHGPPPQHMGGPGHSGYYHSHNHGPPMPPHHFNGGPQYHNHNSNAYPPHQPSSMPPQQHYHRIDHTDSMSVSSKSSKNSRKKRTIDGVHENSKMPQPPQQQSYGYRGTDSTSSSTSTVTAGNNISGSTSMLDDNGSTRDRSNELPPLNMNGIVFEENSSARGQQSKPRQHRRDMSADASTTSTLSVGGFSMTSFEGPRVGAVEDTIMGDAGPKNKMKRHKSSEDGSKLVVDTRSRSLSVDGEQSARFEHLTIDPTKGPPSNQSSTTSSASKHQNIFLTLSTSPINQQMDHDQTPLKKNTAKKSNNVASIFKRKGGLPMETNREHLSSDTPTSLLHTDLATSATLTDEQSTLNRHLRGQSFTPLPHLNTESHGNSPTNEAMAAAINPQLSWSIAGDTPSIGDLAEWEEEHKKQVELKTRPMSACSTGTRNMALSPHDFQLWKEEHDMGENNVGGTTTPLPAFFSQMEGSENNTHHPHSRKHEDSNHMVPSNGGHSNAKYSQHGYPGSWGKHDMPPTPAYASSEYRDDGYTMRSPDGDRRHEMEFYQPYIHHHHHPSAANERIRNLRGRVPPGHMPPMPLHIHPGMSSHLPMTPMGLGPPKAGMWSPHGGMHPSMASPHHMGSPLNNMAQSKRKCVPLKPPIPSKFQGDMEKAKGANVPEFTTLVNFPAHISQKQAVNLPEGMRCCVMCGQACPCSLGGKNKKTGKKSEKDGSLAPRSSNGQDLMADKNAGYAIIPTQNKGLCTLCDVNVWIVVQSGLEIKWCKGCKNFRPWAAFGEKGLATKCLRCRDRQREKYALQKEEKEKTRSMKIKEKS